MADGANILTVTRSKTLDVCRPDGSWADFNITYHIEYYCSGILIYKELKCLCETAVELLEFHQMQQMKLVLLLDQKMLISVSKSPRRRPQTSCLSTTQKYSVDFLKRKETRKYLH